MNSSLPILRFAPSPNGRLHLGHAYSALLNAQLAAQWDGRFLVRIEDIDTTRCTPALAQQALDDLRWLGLAWEEPVRVQSQHFDDYIAAADALRAQHLLYPCFCTRTHVAQHSTGTDPDGAPLYHGACASLPMREVQARMQAGEPHAWRLRMQQALAQLGAPLTYPRMDITNNVVGIVPADPTRWGDVILVRKETPTSYHLSVVVDDALQAITHVVRGRDLEAATDVHVLLQALLGLPTPRYHHHALITMGGEKLSKSKASESLAELRARGVTPHDIRGMLA